jgi:sugar lactone lactonase YvrE
MKKEKDMERKLTTLMDGLTFGEGPRWYQNKFYFSDFYSHKVYALDLEGNYEVIVEVPNQPSGLGWMSDGTMLIVSMKDRKLLSFKDNVLEEKADLKELAGFYCNDMVVDIHGNAYIGNFGFNTYAGEEIKSTNLILVRPGEEPCVAADDLMFPNGTVITEDRKTLIVGETYAAKLTAFDINEDATLSNRRVWADLTQSAEDGNVPVPDGMCLDAEGAIWVASPSTAEVIRVKEGGEILERIPVATNAYACMLGGKDLKTLFICTSNASGVDPDSALKEKSGKIEIVEVDVPGVGRP